MFLSLKLILCLILLVNMAVAGDIGLTKRIDLNQSVILVDPAETSYVQYAIEDLQSYLKEITGSSVSSGASLAEGLQPVIVIGNKAAQKVLGEPLPEKDLGAEGYLLRTIFKQGREYIVASGAGPRGTKYGVAALMKAIQAAGHSAYLETPIDIKDRPAFAQRGMHFNGWPFNYPYSFFSWREPDWKAYIDILGYHGVNVLFMMPLMEILPLPLSTEDEAYLQDFRRIVEYAQTRHGIDVWMMQSPNRVARDNCGVRDPRKRPLWRPSQVDMDPADPAQFAAIMQARQTLYCIVNNVDGVCTIDGDPGECPESPLSEYARILVECRSLLDKYNIHGKQTKMINWMWGGWGRLKRLEVGHTLLPRCFDPEFQAETVQMLKRHLPEPWVLMPGKASYLPICQREGVLERAMYLPYGTIEGEPAYPSTNLDLNKIRVNLGILANYDGVGGVMGNAQTPLLQLPHIYFYFASIWDTSYLNRPDKAVLLDLSGLLYPDRKELVADCFAALNETDPEKLEALAARLDSLVRANNLGRPGLYGRKLFPNHKIAAEMLLMQLRLNSAQSRLLRAGTSREECARFLEAYFDAYLVWDKAHGWHNLEWGWSRWQLGNLLKDQRCPALVNRLSRLLGDEASVSLFFVDIENRLLSRHQADDIRHGCIEPMKKAIVDVIGNLARHATLTASVEPNPTEYPATAANDSNLNTKYWPGAIVQDNAEWLQLTWDAPQTFSQVVVYFLPDPSMVGRTIHLQKELVLGKWEDFAIAVIPLKASLTTPHAVAKFDLPSPVTLNKIRVANLRDVFEFEVR